MIPLAAGLLVGQGAYQLYQAYKNKEEADRLAKLGPQDTAPQAFRQMQQNLANQSNNAQIAGYGQTVDNMNEQQSSALGEAKRAGITSSNTMNVLTRLNQQRQKANRDLGIEGSRQQLMRLNQYNQALGTRGQYQEQGRQENARAVGALRGASKQNVFNAITSGIGAASYGLGEMQPKDTTAITSAKFEPGIPDPDLPSTAPSPELTPTPEMAGMEASNPNLFAESQPNPYVYQPQGTKTYEPAVYKELRDKRALSQLANPYLNYFQNR